MEIGGSAQMTLDWPNLGVGAILGFLAHWGFVEWEKWKARRARGCQPVSVAQHKQVSDSAYRLWEQAGCPTDRGSRILV